MPEIGINLDAVISSQDVYDLLMVTMKKYPHKGKLNVLQERHNYPIMNRMFRSDRMFIRGGTAISEKLMIDENGAAKMVQPFAEHEGNVVDVMATMEIPWRQAQTNWDIEKGEILRNAAGKFTGNSVVQIVDITKIRRASSDLSMANLIERLGWKSPTSAADKLNPFGIFYWLMAITTEQVAASNGGDHIGTHPTWASNTAGIDSSDDKYALWRSYADVWDNNTPTITNDDIRKMVRMHRHLEFQVPMNARDWESETFSDYQAYVSESRLEAMEERARENNQSLGADLGKFSGQVVIKGTPVNWAKDIDDVSSDPLVLLNHNHWNVFVLEGDNFAESTVPGDRRQHRMTTTFTDLTFNIGTLNRRKCGGRIDYVE